MKKLLVTSCKLQLAAKNKNKWNNDIDDSKLSDKIDRSKEFRRLISSFVCVPF